MASQTTRSKRIIAWALLIVGVVLVASMTRSVVHLARQRNRLQEAQSTVAILEEEKERLQAEKEYYQSEEFVEKEARDRLNMSRPGEAVVVMPPSEERIVYAGQLETEEPIWRQWLAYFGVE